MSDELNQLQLRVEKLERVLSFHLDATAYPDHSDPDEYEACSNCGCWFQHDCKQDAHRECPKR